MNKNFFKNKNLLITGGTGSFGKALVEFLIKNKFPLKKIIIYSRDELKQFEMKQQINPLGCSILRYFLGDIRDKDRLKLALKDVDIVIHAAALKQVEAAEYNPFEFIKKNIIGSQNLIEACLDSPVQNLMGLSTDKASSPVNLYGATKLCADKIFIGANNIKGKNPIKFSIVRYGNVMGSRGSVIHSFLKQKKNNLILITDKKMTRFNINMDQAIEFVMNRIPNSKGGEIFVPKLPSFYITDLAKAVCSDCKIKIIGVRPGEKIHEEMISINDSAATVDLGNYYAIINKSIEKYYNKYKFLGRGFSYSSDLNDQFLSLNELRKIVHKFCL